MKKWSQTQIIESLLAKAALQELDLEEKNKLTALIRNKEEV